jgi:hypothetical protein
MADTISISPSPEIKCYGGNIKLCHALYYDSAKTTPKMMKNITDEERLWTGESAYCVCTHHVVHHCTVRDLNGSVINIHCHGDEARCNCEFFRTRSIRLSYNSYYDERASGDLANV